MQHHLHMMIINDMVFIKQSHPRENITEKVDLWTFKG